MTQPPLLLVDNVFDAVGLYPGAVVDASSEVAGSEAFRVADYRRERTVWKTTTDGSGVDAWVRSLLPAARAADYVFLDRGHNLGGKTVYLENSLDGATWSIKTALNVPASGVVAGTPTAPAMCATEEGAAWTLLDTTTSRVWWRLRIPYTASFIPVVTGLMVGLKTQLLGYGKVFDEDAGERTQVSQESVAGYRATDTTYAWRTVELRVGTIGAAEYDSTFRTLRRLLFERNQPWVNVLDYGTSPERAWMFQFDGTRWSMPKSRVYRDGVIVGRELGQRLG